MCACVLFFKLCFLVFVNSSVLLPTFSSLLICPPTDLRTLLSFSSSLPLCSPILFPLPSQAVSAAFLYSQAIGLSFIQLTPLSLSFSLLCIHSSSSSQVSMFFGMQRRLRSYMNKKKKIIEDCSVSVSLQVVSDVPSLP